MAGNVPLAKTFVSDISSLKPEHQAAIGTDVKQHTMIFATDPDIQYALSRDENAVSFSWKDIVMSEDAPNVFLCLDQSRLEQWSGVIRLMITQLIRQIGRRPDKYSPQGKETRFFSLGTILVGTAPNLPDQLCNHQPNNTTPLLQSGLIQAQKYVRSIFAHYNIFPRKRYRIFIP